MALYVIVSTLLCQELERFNKELKELGRDEFLTTKEIEKRMLELYNRHIQLAAKVRAVDNFFQVYTFVLIGLNVPFTVFTIINMLFSLQSAIDFAVNLPSLVFCLTELIGLTAVPAKLHDTIRKVEGLIYSNRKIWHPYDKKVYLIAETFVFYVKNCQFGITVWGFAMLTKPTILTVSFFYGKITVYA
uniref:Uncharacterized protein n=1 Tax=Panagrolaimus sp. JU765 TaxID=591449 RepID=A0AC34QD94_9BILA